jgi:hypothetical protein
MGNRRRFFLVFAVMLLILVFIIFLSIRFNLLNVVQGFLNYFNAFLVQGPKWRTFIDKIFSDIIFFVTTLIGFFATLYFIIIDRATVNRALSIFFLTNISISLIYRFTPLWPIFHFFYPHRALILSNVLSIVLISCFVKKKFIEEKTLLIGKKKIKISKTIRIVFFLTLILLLGSIGQTYSPHGFTGFGWFLNTSDNISTLEFVHENISASALILNSPTYTDLYLLSFSIKNVVFASVPVGLNRSFDLIEIWQFPQDKNRTLFLLNKHRISFLMVTNDSEVYPYYFSLNKLPYTSEQYIRVFDTFDFLTPVFRTNQTAVYEVKT